MPTSREHAEGIGRGSRWRAPGAREPQSLTYELASSLKEPRLIAKDLDMRINERDLTVSARSDATLIKGQGCPDDLAAVSSARRSVFHLLCFAQRFDRFLDGKEDGRFEGAEGTATADR